MTTTVIRKKLQEYIKTADDKKIKAIFTLVESDLNSAQNWWEDKDFVAELNDRVKRYEEGIDIAFTFEEVKEEILRLKSNKSERF
jgi:hypothetical protein